jgi:hypothetical protein
MRPDDEIDEQVNQAQVSEEQGFSKWPGMTYEQGVLAALRWVRGDDDEPPMSDE